MKNNHSFSHVHLFPYFIVFLLSITTTSMYSQNAPENAKFNDLVIQFFGYDRDLPLNERVVETVRTEKYIKQKIVFDGVQNRRVPGYFVLPNDSTKKSFPCILLFHSGASSKESWWQENSFEKGKILIDQLLASGYAVLMLDAQYHGERIFQNDYESSRAMFYERNWYHRYRELMVQTTIDYRRAIDYLETRDEIDTSQIGAFGTSVGANMILVLATVDERVKSIVVCSTLMDGLPEPIRVFDPIYFSPANKDAAVLLQVGKTDKFSPTEKVERIFEGLPVESKKLIYYEFGHEPTAKYVEEAVAWFIKHK